MTDVHGDQREFIDQLTGSELSVEAPRRPRWWPFALVALAVLAAAAIGYVVVIRDTGPPHPDTWDARVEKLAKIVEDERDLTFEHPVYVDFLSEAEFTKKVTADDADLTDEDRTEIEQTTGLFRALGLIEGELDLFESVNKLSGAGIVGYYSYEDERIRIRGTEVTPAVQSTLVHELTHVLQDQHFDLEEKTAEAEDDSAASSSLDALVEGDARRIEAEWRDSLSEQERKAVVASLDEQSKGFGDDAADIPEVLTTLLSSPYALGEAMLAVAVEQGGDRAVDELFRRPPTTEEHQLDPWTLVQDHAVAIDVPEPKLSEGDEKFDDGPFGAVSWLLVLAERIPVEDALKAADGWGGDAYVAFERDGASCVRIDYRGDTRLDLRQMKLALEAWDARLPKAPASVQRNGSLLSFESCDPGPKADSVASQHSQDALSLALSRTYLSVNLADNGFEPEGARCAANLLVRELTVKELNDPKINPKRVQRIIAPCQE